MRIKRARWWDQLGGKLVSHAASPRFENCFISSLCLSITYILCRLAVYTKNARQKSTHRGTTPQTAQFKQD